MPPTKLPRTIEGMPLKDARTPLVVTIKAADIRGSEKKSPDCCAAAVALCRQLHVKKARVYLSRTYILERGQWVRYVTPQALRTEIIMFDRAGIFEPGDYRLDTLKHSQRMGYKSPNEKRAPHKTSGKFSKPLHTVAGVRPSAPKGGRGDTIWEINDNAKSARAA